MPRTKETRADNHSGNIVQRGDSWRGVVMIAGKRRSFTAPTKREVQAQIRKAKQQADDGLLPPPDKLTVQKYLEEWLEDVKRPKLRPNIHKGYCDVARLYLVPAFGAVKLKDLRAAHLQRLYREMSERGLAANTIQRTHAVIRGALRHAVNTGLLPRSVAAMASPPTAKPEEIMVLDAGQVRQLLSAAAGTTWEMLLRMAIFSQMRLGELLGLRWSDVDLERGTVRVMRQRGTDGSFGEPKSAAGRRTIILPATTVEALREHRRQQLEARLLWGPEWEDHDLVFCSHTPQSGGKASRSGTSGPGRPLAHRNVDRQFKAILERAGLAPMWFHDLRHTGATMLLAQGVTVNTVAQRLGHADVMVTLRTYAHVLPTMQREAAAKLDELLG